MLTVAVECDEYVKVMCRQRLAKSGQQRHTFPMVLCVGQNTYASAAFGGNASEYCARPVSRSVVYGDHIVNIFPGFAYHRAAERGDVITRDDAVHHGSSLSHALSREGIKGERRE